MSQELILITDPRVRAVPIKECNEPLIDIKQNSSLLYGPAPECEETANDYTKMRQSVFKKLCLAQQSLREGLRFRVYEAYRSLKVQQRLFDQEYSRVSQLHPEYDHPQRFLETTRLISPVINLDQSINVPPHSTGAAVDIEVIDQNSASLDMGMTIKDWSTVPAEQCMTECTSISTKAQENRRMLCQIMEAQGFVNYPTEWWHFSYGDRYWAYLSGADHAVYGTAKNN